MMDYSSIILARLSDERYKKLQVIQNTAIRSIFKQKFDTPTTTLHELSNIVTIKDRFHDLNERYLLRSMLNNNPITTSLVEEYLNYANGRNNVKETLLCHYKEAVEKMIV